MEGFTKFLESGGKEGGAPAGEEEEEDLDLDVSESPPAVFGVGCWWCRLTGWGAVVTPIGLDVSSSAAF